MISRAEKVELGLIVIGVGVLTALAKQLPARIELGSMLAIAALALLLQGLVRDVWLLRKQRRADAAQQSVCEETRCMCVESTVGLAGVLTGVLLTALAVQVSVPIAVWLWPLAGAVIWCSGFAMKDMVIQWSPWKLSRIKDHGSILVRWR